VAWSPDSKRIASGSVDTNVIVWSVENQSKRITIKGLSFGCSPSLALTSLLSGAHPTADLTNLAWLSNTTLLTSGHDVCFRLWEVKLE
jgi:WD40 repeat protein